MVVDYFSESDIELVRRRAHVQQIELKHALRAVKALSDKLDALRGTDGSAQATLDLVAEATNKDLRHEDPAKGGPSAGGGKRHDRKPRKDHGPTPQPELDLVKEVYELDEPDRTCPACGQPLEEMDGQAETSEMIDVVEVNYRVVQVERKKYRCRCGGCVETAPGPERAMEGGRYSLDFGVKVAHDKYEHHLPLERQCRIMKRHGLKVESQTLWGQLWAMAMLLKPVSEAVKAWILSHSVIGVDQTGWPDLKKKGRKWQMWALTAPGAVHHSICDDKSAATMLDLLGDYRGTIVADRFSSHDSAARDGPGFTMVGCWAHIRRKFADCEADFPEARTVLDLIRELYDVEDEAENIEDLARLRQTKSKDILKRIHAWVWSRTAPSTTALGAAAKHLAKHWAQLKAFADNPEIWIDNNPTERAIRGPVVGRRNHLGSKSRRGREAAAILYTVIETAKLHRIDVRSYLRAAALRSRRSDGSDILLPWDSSAPQ